MTTIYKVISNVKHNGDEFKKDTFFQGNEGEFAQLVADGILKAFDAESIEEAQAIDAKNTAIEAGENDEEILPPNTWEAKKAEDEVIPTDDTANAPGDAVTPTEPEAKPTEEKKGFLGNLFGGKKAEDVDIDDKDSGVAYNGPMGHYKITGDIFPLNEDGSKKDTPIEHGTIHEVPAPVGEGWIKDGLAVPATEDEIAEATKTVDLENGDNL